MKRRKKAAGKIVSSVLCSALAVSMAVTPVMAAPGLENQSTEGEADSVSERFLLNYQTVELNLSDSFDLPLYLTTGYYTEPSGTGKITWTSSNPGVAAVSAEGRVHAVAEGTATITAVHADYPGREAVCEVTVYQNAECSTFYYVSSDGSDDNPGTEEAPFQTIQKARDTIRGLESLPEGGITVILEDGKYYQSETLTFTPEDSGTKEAPVIYKARNEGGAVVTGEVPVTGWQKADDSEVIAESAKGNVYVADVEQGWRFHDLYVNGERQQVSRSVNSDTWRDWPRFSGTISSDPEKGTKVTFGEGELDGLEGNEDVEVMLMPVMYWNSIPLVKYIDAESRTAYLQSQIPSNFWKDHFDTGLGNYNIYNTLKYLDEPGEWCVDSQEGKVYYWPKDEETINEDEIVAPKPYELVRLQGDGVEEGFEEIVENITFDGISFQYTDRLPENEFPEDWVIRNAENPDASLYFDGTANCRVINCEISHSGAYGITVNHYGQNNRFLHNQLHDLGSGGIQFYGYGVGTTDVNHHNTAMFNSIYNMGVAPYQHSAGLTVFGSGQNTMAYNYIAQAPYAGIAIMGTDENSISSMNPNTRAAYDLFGNQSTQYGIRFDELDALPESERDGAADKGEYFSIGTLAEKYQHSERNVAEYNILDDYSQSMDDGGALYSWYCGLGNVYAYNVLKEELQGSRTWVFRLYMDDRALGFTLQDNQCTGNFNGTIDKSFEPYANRWVNNNYEKYPNVPAGYEEQRTKILETTEAAFGGFKLAESEEPAILEPESGDQAVQLPTTFVLKRCENASKYKIEIAADPEFTDIVSTIETRSSVVTTDELLYDTEYYARVTTKEYLGDQKTSEVISFRTEKQPVPDKPLNNVKLTNDIDAVLVQWDAVDKNYVNVLRRAEGETDFTLIAENVSGNGYLDSQVEAGKTYTYVVIPVNASGEGPASEELSVTVKEPEVLFTDDFDNGTISDLWTDAAGNQVNANPDDAVVEDGQWVPSGSWKEYYVGINNADWADYAVEADITFNGLQEGAEDYSAFGLITRANYDGGKHFYQFLIRSRQTVMELQKCDGNYWTMLKQVDTGKEPQPGDVYRMRFESVGNTSRMYLNGILFAEFEDDSYLSGGIGIGYGKDNISIDNVRVCRAKTEEVPEEPADKTILQKTYDYALTLSTDGVVDSAKAYFEKVLAEAQAVLEDENATQEEVNTAWNNLLEGIWGLGIYQGDKTTLNLLIETAEAMTAEADRYVTENWDLLTAALEEAKAVAADGDALEEDITPAADALLDAILAQRYKADKSNLEDLITKTESMDLSGYTEESVAVLNRALAAAYTVLEDESLSTDDQAEVDNAVLNLEKAVAGLEKADSGEGGSTGGSEDGNTGDSGTDDGAGTGDDGSTTGDTGNGNAGNNGGTSDDASKGDGSGSGSGSDGKEGSSDGKSVGSKTPKTGDGMDGAAAAAGMMALSAAVAAIAVLRFRKRQ